MLSAKSFSTKTFSTKTFKFFGLPSPTTNQGGKGHRRTIEYSYDLERLFRDDEEILLIMSAALKIL